MVEYSYPYEKVLCIYFRGNIDEGQPGYVLPEDDDYLKDIQKRFHDELLKNIWEGKKVHCWDILKSEISGPDSSGYENTLTIVIGFLANVHSSFGEERWKKFEELVNEFK